VRGREGIATDANCNYIYSLKGVRQKRERWNREIATRAMMHQSKVDKWGYSKPEGKSIFKKYGYRLHQETIIGDKSQKGVSNETSNNGKLAGMRTNRGGL